MRNWGIRKRVLFLALLPTFIITIALASYFNFDRISDLEASLHSKGQTLANHLAPACEYGIFSSNTQILESLIDKTLVEDDIVNITITNSDNQIIINKSATHTHKSPESDIFSILIHPDKLEYHAAITTVEISVDPYDDLIESNPPDTSKQHVIGYVYVTLSTLNTRILQLDSLIKGLLIAFSGLILTGFLALKISRSVVNPVQQLTSAVQGIAAGKLNTRIHIDTGGEIGELEAGVNKMAQEIQSVREDLQTQIDLATSKLKKTLDELEIQNIELDLARSRAISANRIKSEFLANMSHEIRTPMNGVLGFTELLEKTPLDEQQKDFVDAIHNSASNLLTIINDILDFSKIESGKLEIEHLSFNLADLMDDTLSMFVPMAYKKNIEILMHPVTPMPCQLLGDPSRIRQILINLIGNAIKFTTAGFVIIRVLISPEENDIVNLKFSVTDTGIGMDENNKSRLFNAFTQADTTISRKFGGTGLGLVISRKLAALMEGDIGFDSTLNKGSTFWFTLPLKLDSTIPLEHANFSGKQLILFEESDQCRIALRAQLEELGIEVEECSRISQLTTTIENHPDADAIIAGIHRGNIDRTFYLEKVAKTLAETKLDSIVIASVFDQHELASLHAMGLTNSVFRCASHRRFAQQIKNLLTGSAIDNPDTINSTPVTPDQYHSLESLSALLVDDNEINLKLVKTLLENLHVKIDIAHDGIEAVNRATEVRYDIILMDLHMPNKDGFAATAEIRNTECMSREATIIALTANALPDERNHMYDVGMDDILLKPVNEMQLANLLQRWLNRTQPIEKNTDPVSDTRNPENPPVYDEKEAIELAGGNVQLAVELVTMLIDELPEHLEIIKNAFSENDLVKLRNAVHKLHGGCKYTGVGELREATRKLENAIDEHRHDQLEDHVTQVVRAITRLQSYQLPPRQNAVAD